MRATNEVLYVTDLACKNFTPAVVRDGKVYVDGLAREAYRLKYNGKYLYFPTSLSLFLGHIDFKPTSWGKPTGYWLDCALEAYNMANEVSYLYTNFRKRNEDSPYIQNLSDQVSSSTVENSLYKALAKAFSTEPYLNHEPGLKFYVEDAGVNVYSVTAGIQGEEVVMVITFAYGGNPGPKFRVVFEKPNFRTAPEISEGVWDQPDYGFFQW